MQDELPLLRLLQTSGPGHPGQRTTAGRLPDPAARARRSLSAAV